MSRNHSLNRRWLMGSAATGLAMLMSAAPAMAQDDDDSEEDVVVVRGLKSAIQQSIATKADSTSIVEAISAEDIGKLPDVSIAESLARLPGLAAQRLRGRAQVISVRGLGPDFTTALLNGREQVTAGDNRGVEFDQFPAELLSSVLVYKTPDAQLIGQGLAGTADLQTIRPLDFGQRALSIGARYEFNDQDALNAGSENDGYRFTASYIDQFADGTVGIVLGIATQSTPTQSERFEAWGYPQDSGGFVAGGVKPYSETRELERDAFLGTLEWEPNDTFNTSIDVFYSEFEDVGVLRGVELPLIWGGRPLTGAVVEDGVVQSGTFEGVQGVLRNDNRFREAELFSFGWNGQWQVNDQWALEADYSRSSVDRLDTDLETYSGTGRGAGTAPENGASDDMSFMLNGDGIPIFNPQLDYSDPSLFLLTDPQGWGQVGFIKQPETEDELDAIRLSATRTFDSTWIDSIELGVNHTSREKNKVSEEAFLRGFSGSTADAVPVPSEYLLGESDFSWIGIGPILSYDSLALYNDGFYSIEPNVNPDVITKAWEVKEDVTTWYAQLNILSDWGQIPVRGNFGFQYIDTDQESTGASIGQVNGVPQFVTFTDGAEYSEFLPSLNLSFEVMPDLFIRTSYAKTLARARMDDLRASRGISLNNSKCGFLDSDMDGVFDTPFYTPENGNAGDFCIETSGGNPQLRPYTADAYDLSIERYFADRAGYVSLAVFYKEIDDFVFQNFERSFDFTAEANAIFGADFVAANPTIVEGSVNTPANVEGGHIQGIELATNIPGEAFLPPPFDGFGLLASYSITDSEITDVNGNKTQIPGLSEDIFNVTAYYEKNGFQARVSSRYRSDFLGEVTGFGAGLERRQVQEETVIDAQVGYTFEGTGTRLDGVSILLQGQNLTDEDFVTIDEASGLPRNFETYGATYLLGVNWRM